ncbi:MAG: hypothetical protein ABF802_09365 [Acetobacter orientalis]
MFLLSLHTSCTRFRALIARPVKGAARTAPLRRKTLSGLIVRA